MSDLFEIACALARAEAAKVTAKTAECVALHDEAARDAGFESPDEYAPERYVSEREQMARDYGVPAFPPY
jgi:hypothetical protein